MLGFTFYKLTEKNIKELFQDFFSKLVNNIERKEGRYQGYATHIRCPGLWFQNFILRKNIYQTKHINWNLLCKTLILIIKK